MCAVSGIQDLIGQPPHYCLGFILAGGRSSRMGKDKARVRIGQRTMLQIARSLLDTAPLNGHVVVGGEYADWHEKSRGYGPARAICDVVSQLAQTDVNEGSFALFMPLDMPLLTNNSLSQMIQVAKAKQQAVYFQEHYLPLIVPVTAANADTLQTLIRNDPAPSVRHMLASIHACSIAFGGSKRELSNINTPTDLALISA